MEYITIKGFSNYEINEKGEIRNKKTKRILKQTIDSYKCYYKISIVNDIGKSETISVHRLLALTFIPNPLNKPAVDHINRVKTDNTLSNLRWVSFKENSENTEREDRRKYSMSLDCKTNKWLVTIKKNKMFFNDIDKAYEYLKINLKNVPFV
jgi:hypothetical protein